MRKILILSDGRPGHANLSDGIAAAIERLGPAQTVRVEVRRGGWPGAVLAALVRSRLPARTMLQRVYGLQLADLPAADIVVSAGAETLAANVWVARGRSIPNIFYGSLRLFSPLDFTLVLTSYARRASRPHHALALKPSRLDPDQLSGRRAADATDSSRPLATAALIIGGNSGTYTYRDADWTRLLGFIEQTARSHGTRWLVSNSRRTPDAVSDRLAAMVAEGVSPVEQFIDVRQPMAARLSDLLGKVDAVVCTNDSSSMISECVWARTPVLGVFPREASLDRDEQSYRDWLSAEGWSRELAIADLNPATFAQGIAALRPMRSNPLERLSQLLVNRIPALTAPTAPRKAEAPP
ncbi:MAG: ELM1/GtrOC1 family putative glycosyltransferase [Hyphomicrobiaceae bacterium]